jgi:O-antigen/teichoic acid export membrane protein
MGDDLKKKMVSALTWTMIDKFGQQFVQLFIGIVLARLLSPNDYGLIGVLMIFISLSTVLIDGGFGQALIRKQNASETDFSTIFYLNIIVSISLYLLLFLAAPFISVFFKQPLLTQISRTLFLTILFYSVYFIQYVILNKRMNFKMLAYINILSLIISGIVGVSLAFMGFGVWALVWQQISSQCIRAILFPFFVHWKPIREFSFRVIKEFWNFSVHMLGTASLNVIFNNLYTILLGRFYPFQQVGYYAQANKLSETVNVASQQILLSGTFPLLVQIQHDNVRLIRVYRKLTTSVSLLVFPLIAVLIAIAKPFIIVLISEKWLFSVALFQLLLIANFFGPLYSLNVSVLNAKGESKLTFNLELIKKSLILLSVVLCFSYGIKVMLVGYILASFIAYLFSMFFIKNKLHHYISHQLIDILPKIGLSIGLGLVAAGLSFLPFSNLVLVIIQLSSVFLLYLLAVRLFYPRSLSQALDFFRSKNPFVSPDIKPDENSLL